MSVPHNHAVPVFGCLSCISDERKGTIEKFLVEVPAPKCPKCSRSMEPYEEHTTTMTVFYLCEPCDEETEVKVR